MNVILNRSIVMKKSVKIKLAVKGMFYEYIAALFKSQNVGSVCK